METLALMEIVARIAVAVGLGGLLGLERTLAGKTAGMRTFAMVSLGSALFIIVAQTLLEGIPDLASANPLLIASAVITGIGFIGAGLVIFQDNKITGLTTAAGLWVSAGVGMASGYGLYSIAMVATIAALVIFTVLWFFENTLKKLSYEKNKKEDNMLQ